MQSSYGWTLAEIDGLSDEQRERVRRQWATRALYQDAERYLAEWQKQQNGQKR